MDNDHRYPVLGSGSIQLSLSFIPKHGQDRLIMTIALTFFFRQYARIILVVVHGTSGRRHSTALNRAEAAVLA
jgi:hypothetical protein